jgi:hypothetical protein
MPKIRYEYSPRLPPVLRFDSTGQADKLPELLQKAQRQPLTAAEATQLAEALRNQEPWLRQSKWLSGPTRITRTLRDAASFTFGRTI